MPKGFGKIERKIYNKMPPRVQSFWCSYHTTVKQLLIGAIIAAIAVIGVEARNASETANQAKKEVKVFKQNSPCTPQENGEAERPKQCRESFSKAVQTLTPLQSCHILQKGATIILIGGEPIPPVACILPDKKQRKDEREGSQKRAEEKTTSPTKSSGSAGNESTNHQGGNQHGGKPSHHGGSGGNGQGGGSPHPTSPVGSPGDGEAGSGGSSGNEGGGSGGESGSSEAGRSGVTVEVLPEVELPAKPEVCVENILNVNCENK